MDLARRAFPAFHSKRISIKSAKIGNNQLQFQKQPPRDVLKKRCSENMQQIYRRTPMPKCDFNKVEIGLWHGCSICIRNFV